MGSKRLAALRERMRGRMGLALAGAGLGAVFLIAGLWALMGWITRPADIEVAFANSLSGAQALAGSESLIATQLYIDEVNRAGGVRGHKVRLRLFDDRSDPAAALSNAKAIADSDCVAVLGHFFSNASLAASPVYRNAHLPALTGTALADELTTGSPYYFRAQATISAEARSIAEYLAEVWRMPRVDVILSTDASGRDFLAGFAAGYRGRPFSQFTFDSSDGVSGVSLRRAVDLLAKAGDPDVIAIGAGADSMPQVVEAIRRRGLHARIITAANTGSEQLNQAFNREPEERARPGALSGDLFVAAPLIFDSTEPEARVFADHYAQASGKRPSWIGAGAYDSAHMLEMALERTRLGLARTTRIRDREQVRAALASLNRPEGATQGLVGPLYFNADRNITRSLRVGQLDGGVFRTQPEQLVLVENPERVDLPAEIAAGHIVIIGDHSYWRQRVVYTGIDINEIKRVDIRQGIFSADFYLWMRFSGDDDAPTHVAFPDFADKPAKDDPGQFNPDRPLESGVQEGLNYRLFRVKGNFHNDFDLRDYPFDTQRLMISLQNTHERGELVSYVIDRAGLKLASGRGAGALDDTPYRSLQTWSFRGVAPFIDYSSSTSTLGKPANFNSSIRTEYASYTTEVELRRVSSIFIVKTLTPVFLLVLVVFSTLFFPESLKKEQVTLPVTGILTSAVLLISMNNQLPEVGYAVAIEGVFYVFFALCGMAIFSAWFGERLCIDGRTEAALLLNRTTQVIYVSAVLLTLAYYWWKFGRPGAS